MIKLSLKGLAKYMTASPAGQRKVLRDFKYPDPEGHAMALYYREARDAVEAHHRRGDGGAGLRLAADRLQHRATFMSGRPAARLDHNARAVSQYAEHFGDRNWKLREIPKLRLTYGDVAVTVHPDLAVEERGHNRLVRLEFSAEAPGDQMVRILSQAFFEAAQQAGLGLKSAEILVLDVPRGLSHKGARMGSRMARDIEAACENISAVWPRL